MPACHASAARVMLFHFSTPLPVIHNFYSVPQLTKCFLNNIRRCLESSDKLAMPPKAPSTRGRGRGRGRGGRGRGGASQPSGPSSGTETSDGEQLNSARSNFPEEDPSNPLEFGGLPLESSAPPQPTASTQPSEPVVKSEQPPPSRDNDVSITEAPSTQPAPQAGPPQSSDTATVSDASQPVAPETQHAAYTTASPAPSASTAARGGKKGPVAAPKFAGRRSKVQRDALAAAEAARKAQEPKKPPPPQPRKFEQRRGDGRPGRARGGGYMGDRSKQPQQPVASGPFSSGMVNHDFRRKGGSGMGTSSAGFSAAPAGRSGGSGGYGGGGSSGSRGVKIKTEDGSASGIITRDVGGTTDLFGSGDEGTDNEGGDPSNFIDIDQLNLYNNNETEADGTIYPFRPNRTERAPKGQAMSVAKSSKMDRKRAMRNLDPKKGKQRADESAGDYTGVYSSYSDSDPEDSAIKQEPTEDGTAQPTADQAAKEKKPRNRRNTGPDLQTPEERAEHQRHLDGLDDIVAELGPDIDGDVSMEGAEATNNRRADKVYLFQFPPVLPDLLIGSQMVKAEQNDDEEADAPAVTEAVREVEESEAKVKPDPDAAAADKLKDTKPDRPGAKLSSGAVGKLRVHASGKVTMDWGGTALQLGTGTKMDFLQEVVVARMFEEGKTGMAHGEEGEAGEKGTDVKSDVKQADGQVGGEALSLGQVRGRFVVTPDWEEIV